MAGKTIKKILWGIMRALSIRQPWAWLVATGQKDIENRSRKFKIRGEFLIHASSHKPTDAEIKQIADEYGVSIDPAKLEYGGIIGQAVIADCVQQSNSKWHIPGYHGLVIDSPEYFGLIPCRGNVGFFNVDI